MASVLALVMLAWTGSGAAADTLSERIVGGSRVAIEDHPWVVYLMNPGGLQYCGGTIAAPTKIVTAAHCVAEREPGSVRVVAGREDKNSRDGVVARVRNIWVHPKYQSASQGEDIAVLTLDRRLPYPSLPLADEEDTRLYTAGTVARVYGWGNTSEGGVSSRYLLGATVPLVSDRDCAMSYREYDRTAMVCAGYPEGGIDACQGDSGGPLVVAGKLVGVVSTGDGCARPRKPGIYTRVATYADEVRAQLGESDR
ncbi:MAG TPA: serine protease [Pseudonocardiaceae bacterium]